ncbi:hypothetical protein AAU61_01245 [Desulfocarbo indianensis]|nr:hypothetical protein AAU61_01245 [Desulfocarbo indianensis]
MFYKIEKESQNRPLTPTNIYLIMELEEAAIKMEIFQTVGEGVYDDLNHNAHSLRINLEDDPVLLAAVEALFDDHYRLVFIADMDGDKTKGFVIND